MGIAKEIKNELSVKYAVVYGRVSTTSAEQEKSLERQESGSRFERKMIEDGYTLQSVFSDSESGTDFERNGFEDMLRACGLEPVRMIQAKELNNGNYDTRKAREISGYVPDAEYIEKAVGNRPTRIYCASTSRFCRNITGYDIIRRLHEIGVSCFFKNENIDTAEIGWEFKLQLMQNLDEQQSRQTSEKVLEGMKDSERENVIRCNNRIFGYEYHEGKENSLTIIPEEAEIVKLIFKLFNEEGMGIRQVLAELNNQKITTRAITTRSGKKMGGKSFCINSVKRILTNEKYFGGNAKKYDVPHVFETFRTYASIKAEYLIQMNDRIEPIITFDTFKRAKEILASRNGTEIEFDMREIESGKIYFRETILEDSKKAKYLGTNPYTAKYGFQLKCGDCFHTLYSDREVASKDRKKEKSQRKTYRFFRCGSRKNNLGANRCPNSARLYFNTLEKFLQQEVENMQREIDEQNIILREKILNSISYYVNFQLEQDYSFRIARLDTQIKQLYLDIKAVVVANARETDAKRIKTNDSVISSMEEEVDELIKEKDELLNHQSSMLAIIQYLYDCLSKFKVKDKYDLMDLSLRTEYIVFHRDGTITRVSKPIVSSIQNIVLDKCFKNIDSLNNDLTAAFKTLEKYGIFLTPEYLDVNKYMSAAKNNPEECYHVQDELREWNEHNRENMQFYFDEASAMAQEEFFKKYGADKELTQDIIDALVFMA